jgi:hypothetical protein
MPRRNETSKDGLNYKERQALLKKAFVKLNFFNVQFVAAPRSVKESYIPILSLTSLSQGRLPKKEKSHLNKVLAFEVEALDVIHGAVAGVSELRELVWQKAGTEITQLENLDLDNLPTLWRYAQTDANKLRQRTTKIMDELDSSGQ